MWAMFFVGFVLGVVFALRFVYWLGSKLQRRYLS